MKKINKRLSVGKNGDRLVIIFDGKEFDIDLLSARELSLYLNKLWLASLGYSQDKIDLIALGQRLQIPNNDDPKGSWDFEDE